MLYGGVIERSFAWLARFRRLSRDFERMPEVLASLHFVVLAILMLPKAVMLLGAGQGMGNGYSILTTTFPLAWPWAR